MEQKKIWSDDQEDRLVVIHLAYDRFLAGTAASLLRSVHTLTAHICLKISQHRIQLILFDLCRGLCGMTFPVLLLLIMMCRLSFCNVYSRLCTLSRWQWALRTFSRFIGLSVWRIGHRLMLMRAAIDLENKRDYEKSVSFVRLRDDNPTTQKKK